MNFLCRFNAKPSRLRLASLASVLCSPLVVTGLNTQAAQPEQVGALQKSWAKGLGGNPKML